MTETERQAGQRLVHALGDLLDRIVEHVAVPEEEMPVVEEARGALDEGRRVLFGSDR
ncbi:MAG: hypothetical protein OXH64_09240 [Rhodospirillaceae bacterium]|nr:hypothetical protein [Rhodospirillaceae bacterium]